MTAFCNNKAIPRKEHLKKKNFYRIQKDEMCLKSGTNEKRQFAFTITTAILNQWRSDVTQQFGD